MALRHDGEALWVLDQTRLPWEEVQLALHDAGEVAAAIARLSIRGAPLIGVAAGYGVALALARDPGSLDAACSTLIASRPTAANLAYAVRRVRAAARSAPGNAAAAAIAEARAIHAEEEAASEAQARHGADLLAGLGARRSSPIATPERSPLPGAEPRWRRSPNSPAGVSWIWCSPAKPAPCCRERG